MALPIWFGAHRKVAKLVAAASLSVSASVTNGSSFNIQNWSRISSFIVNVTAIAGASATVTIKLQHSPDGGQTWLDSGLTTSALSTTDTGVVVTVDRDLFPMIRLVATLSATTTPTATYSAWMGYASEQGALPVAA